MTTLWISEFRDETTYDRAVAFNWYDPATLPRFKHPPVVETAMGLEFAPVPLFGFIELAELQQRWIERFPELTELQAVPSSADLAGGPQVQVFTGVPRLRVWAQGSDNGLLVQSQSDRLILNWRKQFSGGHTYPSYDVLRIEFERLWEEYSSFLGDRGFGQAVPSAAEYTYVNHIKLGPGEDFEDVLAIWTVPDNPLPGTNESTQFQLIRSVQSEDDTFPAQVVVIGGPQSVDGQRVLSLNITSKVLFATGGAPFDALDAAHALSSHTFANITTSTKHEEWDRE